MDVSLLNATGAAVATSANSSASVVSASDDPYLASSPLPTAQGRLRPLALSLLIVRLVEVSVHACLALGHRGRRAAADCLGSGCLPYCGADDTAARSTIIGLCGSSGLATVIGRARARFRTVPASLVRAESLGARYNGAHRPLAQAARRTPLGECDAFISHAWIDPATERFAALTRWHEGFVRRHGRPADVWMDQFCVDEANLQADLACLGAYIAGCRRFVMLACPTYASRLWCALELVTFVEMGGAIDDIDLVPLLPMTDGGQIGQIGQIGPEATPTALSTPQPHRGDAATPSTLADAERAVAVATLEALARFDVARSSCHNDSDLLWLLNSIRATFGSERCFNRKVRHIGLCLLGRRRTAVGQAPRSRVCATLASGAPPAGEWMVQRRLQELYVFHSAEAPASHPRVANVEPEPEREAVTAV